MKPESAYLQLFLAHRAARHPGRSKERTVAQGQSPGLIITFQTHYSELLRFLTRRMGDAERARDVVQETYLRVASIHQPTGAIGDPRAYVFRIAGNLAIDTIRKERRIDGRSAPQDAAAAVPDPLNSPERALQARQRLGLLDAALAGLPPKARRALLMSRLDGLTFAEIAAELGVSESMVAKYIAQALRACRDHLRQADEQN